MRLIFDEFSKGKSEMKLEKVLYPLIVSLILFSACSSGKQTIKLGFAGGLSGSGSNLGIDGMYGALLAVDKINEQGGINGKLLELVIKNDHNDPSKAPIVDKELVNEGCGIIIGHFISSVALDTVPFVNEGNVLMVSPTIAKDELSNLDDHFIRLIPSNVTQANLLSETIIELGVSNLGILYSNNNMLFADTFIHAINSSVINSKTKVVANIGFDLNADINYNQLVSDLQELDVDGLLIIASGDVVATFAQYFSLLSFKPKVFLPAWAMTNDLIIRGGKTVENYYGVNYIPLNSLNPTYQGFKAKFQEKYGTEPTFSAIMAYESVMIVAHAMISSRSTDPLVIKDTIIEGNEYHGLFEDLLIDEYGDAIRNISLFKIQKGRFEIVQP